IKKAWLERADANLTGSMSMNMPGMKMNGMDMNNMKSDTCRPMKMKGMQMDGVKMKSDTTHSMQQNMKGMKMDSSSMNNMDHMKMRNMDMDNMKMPSDTSRPMQMKGMKNMSMDHRKDDMVIFNYDMLKALHPTAYDTTKHPVKHLTFNLTGSMWRYMWSINGKPLSEKDSIRVKEGQILRITLNNKTMMYHPMRLHGHFFRVLNANGKYSPLKHTVTVPPMRSVTIEFLAN